MALFIPEVSFVYYCASLRWLSKSIRYDEGMMGMIGGDEKEDARIFAGFFLGRISMRLFFVVS